MSSCFLVLDFVMKFVHVFLPLQAIHFPQEHLMYHDLNIYETAYPVSVHQKILLLGYFCLVLGESICQKESVPNLLFDISEIKFIEEIRHFSENSFRTRSKMNTAEAGKSGMIRNWISFQKIHEINISFTV